MQIKKAVIPVAGLGTRMLPATKAIPKEMLPVVDKPLIQYVIEEAAAAGIKEIVLVTHASKNAIENHFDTSFELEAQLESRLKRSLLEEVRSITPKGLTVISVRQAEAKGLGHAILAAKSVVGDEPFAVLLPDVLVDNTECNLRKDNLAGMTRRFHETGFSQILVEEVPQDQVNNYGVVDCSGVQIAEGQTAPIVGMVEKPPVDEAPSNMAIVGRYVLSKKVWELLATTQPGAGGEIQLTDALHALLGVETIEAYQLIGRSHDCGTKLGYLQANVIYGVRHASVGADFEKFLKYRYANKSE
jgi:UTP--glucose-1-phosphate uridylyltransferase